MQEMIFSDKNPICIAFALKNNDDNAFRILLGIGSCHNDIN